MLRAAVLFLVLAIIAGVFGFGGIASASASMAKIPVVVSYQRVGWCPKRSGAGLSWQ
jgi:uncharacterized membrane protein YtjA (UPF0391 family)